MNEEQDRSSGLGAAANRVWSSMMEGVHLRLELFEIEIREEKQRLLTIIITAGLAVFFSAMLFLCLNLLLLMHFWDERLVVMWSLAGFYLLLALIAWWLMRRRVRRQTAAFHATRQVLEEDRQALRSRSQ